MPQTMPLTQKYRKYFGKKDFVLSVISGALLLVVGAIMNYEVGAFATKYASNTVTDALLNHLPFVNVGILFVYTSFATVFLLIAILFFEPKWIPFTLKSFGIFLVVRSFFIPLTHIGAPLHEATYGGYNILQKLFFGADFFFSGHTGLPFLVALIFLEPSQASQYCAGYFHIFCHQRAGRTPTLFN